MARKNRTPGENARLEKIRELLQLANVAAWMTFRICSRTPLPSSWKPLWRAIWTINWATAGMNTETRTPTTAEMGIAARPCAPALAMWSNRTPRLKG